MKNAIILCLTCIVSLSACSTLTGAGIQADNSDQHPQTVQVVDLYDGAIPGEIKRPDQEVYSNQQTPNLFIGNINQPTISIYPADPEKANGTAVIIFPGGGYWGVSIIKEGYDVAERLNGLGITAFVVKYRTPSDNTMTNRMYGPLQDAQQAIHFVRSNSDQWQLDPNKIGVMGFSAGGHLASSAATHFDHPVQEAHKNANLRPDFQILLYPVISMKDGITHNGSRQGLLGAEPDADDVQWYSNETQITESTPSAFIVHASDDPIVPVANSLLYTQALAQHHIQGELILVPYGGHGFGMRHSFDWFTSLTTWFKQNKLL